MRRDPHERESHRHSRFVHSRGYAAENNWETDLQLRRFLSSETEKVRDRLAEFLAGTDLGERKENYAAALREIAAFRQELFPSQQDKGTQRLLTPGEQEGLLDLDLALLEEVAGLHTPLDRLEITSDPDEQDSALEQFLEGLKDLFVKFRRRNRILQS